MKRCLFIRGPAGAGFCRADGFSLAVQIESPASRRSFLEGRSVACKTGTGRCLYFMAAVFFGIIA